ncbi:MAG: type II toxin-antitoxin system HicA family toxin [Candidatus Rifleibacteriota bacterium]
MNQKKVLKIYDKIITGPLKPMKWQDVEGLLIALGAKKRKGSGSSRIFIINKRALTIHKPHPENEIKKYAVKLIRDYLLKHDLKP